ncbi:hypothetical protein [Streptomyces sp. SS]|nr:hypothetical protein [Streptomyces sp. SS]
MPVQRLDHAVLFVSDPERGLAFHRDAGEPAAVTSPARGRQRRSMMVTFA